jgi:hypothetical protein
VPGAPLDNNLVGRALKRGSRSSAYWPRGVQANGVGDTIEIINTPAALNGQSVKIVVDVEDTSSAVAPPLLDLRWGGSTNIDVPTRAGGDDPDKNYTGLAYAIGAVRASSGNLENFSSAGPVNLLSTTVCPPAGGPGPCAGVAGPPCLRF